MYEPMETNDLSCILKGDSDDIKERIDKINEAIEERDGIKKENIKSLESLILECKNKILEVEQNPYLKLSDKTAWERAVLDLEKIKITEDRNRFVDNIRLREKLIDGLIEYKQSQRDAALQNMLFGNYNTTAGGY